jgi:hypothetical protein
MESIHNDHPYTPLDSDKEEIRLLELVPRRMIATRPIQGRLIHVSLNDSLPFDALSYVWVIRSTKRRLRST